MEKKFFYLRLAIYFVLVVFFGVMGYNSYISLFSQFSDKFSFLFNLGLLGIFIGAVSFAKRPTKSWSSKEFEIYSYLCFIGSLLTICFLGLQGSFFNPRIESNLFREILVNIGIYGETFFSGVLFIGLVGLASTSIVNLIDKFPKHPIKDLVNS